MSRLHAVGRALCMAMAVSATGAVQGQNLGDRPIRIVTAAPGGGADFVARVVAQGLTTDLGLQAIVDNRPGAVVIPAGIVAKASPDGHTLLIYPGTFWIVPLLERVNYDPIKDFSPVSLATRAPVVVVVNPSVPVKSIGELIALAKAKPGELNYGSGAVGSSTHLAAEMFNSMTGTKIVHVAYRGAGPALIGLIGGQVQLMFASGGAAAPHVKAGRVRALAVTTSQPSPGYPGLPTVAAAGVPGYEFSQILGIFAPAGTPAKIVKLLSQALARTLDEPKVKARLFASGVESAGGSPEELMAAVKSDIVRMRKVIRDANIRIGH